LKLPAGKSPIAYILKYEFYEKEMMHKGASSKSVEEDEMETAEDSTCKLPFITQELVIVDRSALKQRIQNYKNN
jgi:hypothetical protein